MENEHITVDGLFNELQTLSSENHNRRNVLIATLMTAISKTDFDPAGIRASDLESRLGMVSTIDSLMKSQEAVQINNLKLNLTKNKDEEESDASGKVIELLSQIAPNLRLNPSVGDNNPNQEEVDKKIAERVLKEGIEISPGEEEQVQVI